MKKSLKVWLIPLLVLCSASALAQIPNFHREHVDAPELAGSIDLWPSDSLPASSVEERWEQVTGNIGGRELKDLSVRNVTVPTLTPVFPDQGKATGTAVIVAPGGAFMMLAIDHEGFNVARELAARGVTAFVLKYRVNESPVDPAEFDKFAAARLAGAGSGRIDPVASEPRATADALQALRLVRENAGKWNINPDQVGMIGFSAGAMTALNAVLEGKPEERPNFIGYIYGPMRPVTVPEGASPMFAAIALDDGLFGRHGFGVVESWQAAKRPVELHAYERGDHGFGLGIPGTTTTLMLDQFLAWLQMHDLLVPAN